jgi:hypothetical protein
VAVTVTRIVIGTMGDTNVKLPPTSPMKATEKARQTASVTRNAASVRTER